MYKLFATIQKDVRVMVRDRVGLLFMFGLPILLVLIVTSIQNSTFELMNKNRVPLLLSNRDTGDASREFIKAVEQVGLFNILASAGSDSLIKTRVQQKDAMLALVIPANFSARVEARARMVAGKAMTSFGLEDSTNKRATGDTTAMPIALYYHPILQESFRRSAEGALYSALQVVESKHILKTLYFSLNEKELPDSVQSELLNNQTTIEEFPVSRDRNAIIPNASQHNVPAWTVFAMFFVVISLGSGIVREKLNGSFVRLKTLPTSYLVAILSKQLTYVTVTLLQAAVIFAIGIWLFPVMGLPTLHFPTDWAALIVVTFLCGWCAVSYAICIGVFARTEEQATGFGSISIVILAAIGGLMVPSFAMPGSFRLASHLSPLHWGLEAYYGLFLEGGGFSTIWANILPLVLITAGLQGLSYWGLKRKNLI
jgi:ABC-2 type transport system permease protein